MEAGKHSKTEIKAFGTGNCTLKAILTLSVAILFCLLGCVRHLNAQTLPDHSFNPSNKSNPYNLVDLDGFSDGYNYCHWGNLMSTIDPGNPFSPLPFTSWTEGPFANSTYSASSPELFLLKSTSDLTQINFPADSIWNPAGGTFESGSVSFPSGSPVLGSQVALMRQLHFNNSLDASLYFVPRNAKKLIILIHGWNPTSDLDGYTPTEFQNLVTALNAKCSGTDWSLSLYHWEPDADTGSAGIETTTANSTQAAEISHLHGQHLGQLLANWGQVQEVQFITHSAGAWAARSAAEYILQNTNIKVEITLLDPFDPGKIVPNNTALNSAAIDQISIFPTKSNSPGQIYLLENYYAIDDLGTWPPSDWLSWRQDSDALFYATSGPFNWRSQDVNNCRVDWVSGSNTPYKSHFGPIQFYADTINATNSNPPAIPNLQNPSFDLTQIGWQRSMFYNEPYFATQPQIQTVNAGGTAVFSVTAVKQGQPNQSPAGLTLQWQVESPSGTWTNIGNGSATLVLSNVSGNMSGNLYHVTATLNGLTETSQDVTLTVTGAAGAPAAPTNLTAIAVSASQINLQWLNEASNATGITVQRQIYPSGSWTQIASLPPNTTSYSDATGLSPGITYSYQVNATTASVPSVFSAAVNATTFSPTAVAYTLNIQSFNPANGVRIDTSNNLAGQGYGITPFNGRYTANATPALVAPSTFGGNPFVMWQKDGVFYSGNPTTYVTVDTGHSMTAVYGTSSTIPTLVALAINGPSSVAGGSSQPYTLTATFSDGSTSNVTTPGWGLAPTTAATISASGVLDAGVVASNTVVTLGASYTLAGVTKTSNLSVTITATTNTLVYTLGVTNIGQGTVVATPNQTQFQAGYVARLSAQPASGYVFSGWSGDATGMTNPLTVTMNGNKNITATFASNSSAVLGSIHTTITPSGAVAAGAAWNVDGTSPWLANGDSYTPTSNGNHTINFASVPGYTTPAPIPIVVAAGQTSQETGAYSAVAAPTTLQVMISPPEALSAGAQWQVDGGTFNSSGTTITGLAAGNHTISYNTITGWATPANQTVALVSGQTSSVTGSYQIPSGVPIVTAIGPSTGPIAGGTPVLITGANFTANTSVTFGGVAATNVTVQSTVQLAATTPASASYHTVPVAVTTPGGTATISNGFTYIVPRGSHMNLVSQIGGRVDAVALQGNYLYVGEGSGFVVLNNSNPASPAQLGHLALPSFINDIAVSGNYAYVATGNGGVFVIDISTPSAPSQVGFYQVSDYAYSIQFQNGLAYVAAGTQGLLILDCSIPALPKLKGSIALPDNSIRLGIMTQGAKSYAVVGTYNSGVQVVDITDPANPNLTSSIATLGGLSDLALSGTAAWVANSNQNGLQLVDLTQPTSPSIIKSYSDYGPVTSIAVQNNIAYIDSGAVLHIENVSNPSVLQPLEALQPAFNFPTRTLLSGNFAYFACSDQGLFALNVSNPTNVTQLASFSDFGTVSDISHNGTTIFVASGNAGFNIVDLSNSAAPQRTFHSSGPSRTVANDGPDVFVGTDSAIQAFRVNQPTSAVLNSTYTQSQPNRVWANGSYLYSADTDTTVVPNKARFNALNYSNLSALVVQSSVTNTAVSGVAISAISGPPGGQAYFSDAGGVHVISFTNTTRPTRMGDCITPGKPVGMATSGDGSYLFVANGPYDGTSNFPGGVSVVDVSNGNSPTVVTSMGVGLPAMDVTVSGSYAIVSSSGSGVYLYDITDPLHPVLRASYNTGGNVQRAFMLGNLLCVGDADCGLVVLQVLDFTSPTCSITTPNPAAPITTTNGTINVAGTANDDVAVTQVTWSNNLGGGNAATGTSNWQVNNIQLVPGQNVLTFTAADATGNIGTASLTVNYTPADSTPPVVNITYPTTATSFQTSAQTIQLQGTATDNVNVAGLSWSNSRGGSGAVTGIATWTAANIALLEGPNVITVTATDTSGNTGTTSITVNYLPPNSTPPSITIQFPTINDTFQAGSSQLNLSGVASAAYGISKITWSNDQGGQGTATGTALWSVNGIALQPGLNVITVAATDIGGNTSTDTLSVTYVPNVPPAITLQPLSQAISVGQAVSFNVAATGTPAPGYQWQRMAYGNLTWANLSDNSTYSGTASSTLAVAAATSAMSGDQFRCLISNGVPTDLTSNSATLTVTTTQSFSQWQTLYGISTGPSATPMNDGVINILKYLFDIDPTVAMSTSDRAFLPSVAITPVGGVKYLTLTYRQNPLETGIAVNVQVSTDLHTWTTVSPPDLSRQVGIDVTTGDPIMQVGVKTNDAQALFMRLSVTVQ